MNSLRIVLVQPSHPRNIGSVARAMKTMGISQLYLVAPKCMPDEKSFAVASGATDVLDHAVIVDTLAEAIAPCSLVIGTSARKRTLDWPILDPRQAADKLVQQGKKSPVALVFGCERTGLDNEQLQLCHYHLQIPANPEYSSLNLAMAVQIVCYEVRMTAKKTNVEEEKTDYPSHTQIELFYEHLQRVLSWTGFLRAKHPGLVMNKIRRLFNRAHLEQEELHILRGILTSVEKKK